MKSPLDSEIRSRIESFLAEMGQLVKLTALEAVHAALTGGNGVAAPRRGPGRPRRNAAPARRARGGKRSPEAVQKTADALLAYVKDNEGQTIEQVAKGMGTSTKELKLPVIKLIEAGALRTEGQKRGTKYLAGGGRMSVKGGRGAKGGKKAGAKKRGRKAKVEPAPAPAA